MSAGVLPILLKVMSVARSESELEEWARINSALIREVLSEAEQAEMRKSYKQIRDRFRTPDGASFPCSRTR